MTKLLITATLVAFVAQSVAQGTSFRVQDFAVQRHVSVVSSVDKMSRLEAAYTSVL